MQNEVNVVNLACKQEVLSGFSSVLFVLLSVQHNGVHLIRFLWHRYESDLGLAHSEHHGCGVQVMIRPPSSAPSPQRLRPLRRPRVNEGETLAPSWDWRSGWWEPATLRVAAQRPRPPPLPVRGGRWQHAVWVDTELFPPSRAPPLFPHLTINRRLSKAESGGSEVSESWAFPPPLIYSCQYKQIDV